MIEPNENTCHVMVTDHTCCIRLPATFTVAKAVEFKQNLQQTCHENPDLTRIAIDCSQTKFMDSSGVGALVAGRKMAMTKGVELVLQNVPTQVMTVLTLADLDRFFTIETADPTTDVSRLTDAPSISSAVPTRLHRKVPVSRLRPRRLMGMVQSDPQPFITHPSVKSVPKRVIDVVGALVGLAITGILFVPIAIAIKLDSRGPIFFGQVRCSRMSQRFKMWKFRSMVVDAEAKKHLVVNEANGAIFKNSNDPRITRVGRFLRKTSLDELPQFWNVLKGEMSLVGTRPPTPDEVERYEIPQWQRLDIKPGMTGEWQVNGRSSVKEFEDIVRLDLKYQENWSLLYDMKLIVQTIIVIFNKKAGAV